MVHAVCILLEALGIQIDIYQNPVLVQKCLRSPAARLTSAVTT